IFCVHHGIEFEPDHREPLSAITIYKFLIARHLFLAGLAPGGPEINEHYLAAKVCGGNLASLQGLHGEIRHARTDLTCCDCDFLRWRKTRRMLITSGEPNRGETQRQQECSQH